MSPRASNNSSAVYSPHSPLVFNLIPALKIVNIESKINVAVETHQFICRPGGRKDFEDAPCQIHTSSVAVNENIAIGIDKFLGFFVEIFSCTTDQVWRRHHRDHVQSFLFAFDRIEPRCGLERGRQDLKSAYPLPLIILAALAAYGETKFSLSLRMEATLECPSMATTGDLGLGRERSYWSRRSNLVKITFMDSGVIKGKKV